MNCSVKTINARGPADHTSSARQSDLGVVHNFLEACRLRYGGLIRIDLGFQAYFDEKSISLLLLNNA